MYVVYRAYDDNTADIIDLSTMHVENFGERQLIKLGTEKDILGLSVSSNKINYINAYTFIKFDSDNELNEYIREYVDEPYVKKNVHGYFWLLKKTNHKYHVDYYVCTYKGDEVTYLGKERNYTPYIQAAKTFSKHEAGEKAALMTKNSKTGTHWTTHKVIYN